MRTFLTAVLVGALLSLGGTGQAAVNTTPPTFFGMHDHNLAGTGQNTGAGSYRLWDTSTAWRDVETSRGVYDWSRLDSAVTNARRRGATVMLVLGGTPRWYAKQPDQPSMYGAGFCSEVNDLGAWKTYVRAVATRYKGLIDSYEPWNEGDILSFYCGSQSHLITLARLAYQTIKAVDPGAIVSSPSFVDRTVGSQYQIMNYLKAGGKRWADVVSYHPYGMPSYGPEQNAVLIDSLRKKMHRAGIDKPVWTTELNYGLPFGNDKGDVSWTTDLQVAYVYRTFLLQRQAGAKRVYWYAWSDAPFLGVKMDDLTDRTSVAYRTVKLWMSGRWMGCVHEKSGRWTCRVRTVAFDKVIRWNPATAPMPRMKQVSR